jgi:hypothetical protein
LIRAFIKLPPFRVLYPDVEDRGRPRPGSLDYCLQDLYQWRHERRQGLAEAAQLLAT